MLARDRKADGAADINPVRAFIEIDQDRQRKRCAGLLTGGTCHGFGGLAREFNRLRPVCRHGTVESDYSAGLAHIRDYDAAAYYFTGARQVSEARSDLPAGKGLNQ